VSRRASSLTWRKEERRLHLKAATSSLFDYCLRRMGLSESEAFHRITAARLARRFPKIFELLEARAIHLSALRLLRDHLTPENHQELLALACNKSKKAVEALVATIAPRPDVASRIRKLPAQRGLAQASTSAASMGAVPITPEPEAEKSIEAVSFIEAVRVKASGSSASMAETSVSATAASTLSPLSSTRHLLRATISHELKDKLERARDLMSHANPSGELTVVLERALELLLEKLEKQRFARKRRPQAARRLPNERVPRRTEERTPEAREADHTRGGAHAALAAAQAREPSTVDRDGRSETRGEPKTERIRQPENVVVRPRARREHIPNEIRRAVASRDGWQCTYRDGEGNRCASRAFLQLHHEHAHALGGPSTIDNLRLLCASHNRLLAERDFGRAHQERFARKLGSANERRPSNQKPPLPSEARRPIRSMKG